LPASQAVTKSGEVLGSPNRMGAAAQPQGDSASAGHSLTPCRLDALRSARQAPQESCSQPKHHEKPDREPAYSAERRRKRTSIRPLLSGRQVLSGQRQFRKKALDAMRECRGGRQQQEVLALHIVQPSLA
jgi:hypothetical protein